MEYIKNLGHVAKHVPAALRTIDKLGKVRSIKKLLRPGLYRHQHGNEPLNYARDAQEAWSSIPGEFKDMAYDGAKQVFDKAVSGGRLKRARMVKGSPAAKAHMARLRALRKHKTKGAGLTLRGNYY